MKRPRSVASHAVGVAEYKSALRAWKAAHQGTFVAVLGPKSAEDIKGVSPSHVVVKQGSAVPGCYAAGGAHTHTPQPGHTVGLGGKPTRGSFPDTEPELQALMDQTDQGEG